MGAGLLAAGVVAGGGEERATGGSRRGAGEIADGAEASRCRPERSEGRAMHRDGGRL